MKLLLKTTKKNSSRPCFFLRDNKNKDKKCYGVYNPTKEILVIYWKLIIHSLKCGVHLSKKSILVLLLLSKKLV